MCTFIEIETAKIILKNKCNFSLNLRDVLLWLFNKHVYKIFAAFCSSHLNVCRNSKIYFLYFTFYI